MREETRVFEGCVGFGAAFGLIFGEDVFDVGRGFAGQGVEEVCER